MRYIIDHDCHIHSNLSPCARDPEQTARTILNFGVTHGLKYLCLTDHYWDAAVPSNWEAGSFYHELKLDFEFIRGYCPLPQADQCRFYFGCETDMDGDRVIGIPKERWDDFDFIIVPTSHMHLRGFTVPDCDLPLEVRRETVIKRAEAFLNADLPWGKVGLAHLTSGGTDVETIAAISDGEWKRIFEGCRDRGCGVELNVSLKSLADPEESKTLLHPYMIAKKLGCKFYLGSDAHTTDAHVKAMGRFNLVVDLLDLEESDKFVPKTM